MPPSSYTVENVHRVLRALVAPNWADRQAADKLLFQFHCGGGEGTNAVLERLLSEATGRFGSQERDFFADVIDSWMDASVIALTTRMREFGGAARSYPWERSKRTPVNPPSGEVRFGEFELYGMGVAFYLRSQGRRIGFLVPDLVRGLQHPEPLVRDACWEILGTVPEQALVAFAPMCRIAFELGSRFAPSDPMRALAAIVDAHAECAPALVDGLLVEAPDRRVAAICGVAEHLREVPATLFDALTRRFERAHDSEDRYLLYRALVDASVRGTDPARATILAHAECMVTSAVSDERAAAVWGLVKLGSQPSHEPLVQALLRDAEWIPRSNAAAAVAAWPRPSPQTVLLVANLLGDFEGHDGYPHYNALTTLTTWGSSAITAIPCVREWLQFDPANSGAGGEALIALLDALGSEAAGLAPAVGEYIKSQYGEPPAHDGAGEITEATDLAPSDDSGEPAHVSEGGALGLALRVGIDVNEEIPGTRRTADLVAEPDAESRLRSWLAKNG